MKPQTTGTPTRLSKIPFNTTLIVRDNKEFAIGLHKGNATYGGMFVCDTQFTLNLKDYFMSIWDASEPINNNLVSLISNTVKGTIKSLMK